jgi:hypothetical protein
MLLNRLTQRHRKPHSHEQRLRKWRLHKRYPPALHSLNHCVKVQGLWILLRAGEICRNP